MGRKGMSAGRPRCMAAQCPQTQAPKPSNRRGARRQRDAARRAAAARANHARARAQAGARCRSAAARSARCWRWRRAWARTMQPRAAPRGCWRSRPSPPTASACPRSSRPPRPGAAVDICLQLLGLRRRLCATARLGCPAMGCHCDCVVCSTQVACAVAPVICLAGPACPMCCVAQAAHGAAAHSDDPGAVAEPLVRSYSQALIA